MYMEFEMTTLRSSKVHPYFCVNYKHMDIVNIIYTSFFEKYDDIEFMSDIMSWIFVKMVMKYRGYTSNDIELIQGTIKKRGRLHEDHIWIHDIKENYYIDFTSGYYSEHYCLCSNKNTDFEGYVPSSNLNINELDEKFNADYDIIEDEGTIEEMMTTIEKKINKRGGKSKRRKSKRRKTRKST